MEESWASTKAAIPDHMKKNKIMAVKIAMEPLALNSMGSLPHSYMCLWLIKDCIPALWLSPCLVHFDRHTDQGNHHRDYLHEKAYIK